MRLLRTHVLRSLTGPFLFAWTALTGMLMLNQLSRRFGELVGKGLPPGVITEVLLLFIPFIVALTLPMAILVAVLYGFCQLASDNEITAMRANGVSVIQMWSGPCSRSRISCSSTRSCLGLTCGCSTCRTTSPRRSPLSGSASR
ncbi:MAG: hypothetical protein DMD43_01380 [Gemmatimonadetes bacterium]|nr:MAG: hypothetical protein DMD43_01380 [Gemmatimonadota bacterium]